MTESIPGTVVRALRIGANLALFGALIPLALLVQLLVVALIPLSLVKSLQSLVAKAQTALTSVVGDTQAFIYNDSSAEAMAQQVRNDLSWLCTKVDRVVIIAHSQGTAVSRRALQLVSDEELRRIHTWVTYGTAMGRFEAMRFVSAFTPQAYWGASAAGVGLTLLAGVYVTQLSKWVSYVVPPGHLLHTPPPRVLQWALGYAGLAALMGLVGLAAPVTMHAILDQDPERFRLPGAPFDFRWWDVYATSDPAPNGPILDPAIPPGNGAQRSHLVRRFEVVNGNSMLTDHTSYWRNTDEFVSLVVKAVRRALPLKQEFRAISVAICARGLGDASRARRKRMWWLVALRAAAAIWLFVLAAAWIGLRNTRTESWGGNDPGVCAAWLRSSLAPLPGPVEGWVARELFTQVATVDCVSDPAAPPSCSAPSPAHACVSGKPAQMWATMNQLLWTFVVLAILALALVGWRTWSALAARRYLIRHAETRFAAWVPGSLFVLAVGAPAVATWLFAKHRLSLRLAEFRVPLIVAVVAIVVALTLPTVIASRPKLFWPAPWNAWPGLVFSLAAVAVFGKRLHDLHPNSWGDALVSGRGPLEYRTLADGRATIVNPKGFVVIVVILVFLSVMFSMLSAQRGRLGVLSGGGGVALSSVAFLPLGGCMLRFGLLAAYLVLLSGSVICLHVSSAAMDRLGNWREIPKRQ